MDFYDKNIKKINKVSENSIIKIKTNAQLQLEDARVRRKIDELPLQNGKMNTISVILSYYLFGLSVNDISILTKIPNDQINNIISSSMFNEMVEKITKSIIQSDQSNVREFLQQQTKKAATKVVEIMENAPTKYALLAAQDILDRSGHRPVDIVEHINKMDAELRIVHITKDENKLKEIKDVEFEEIK